MRVSPKTLELIVDKSELHLYAPPTYLLKLVLPADVVDEALYERTLEGAAAGNGSNTGVGDKSGSLVQDISDDGAAKSLVQVISPDNEADTSDMTPPNDTGLAAADTKPWTEEDLPKMQYDPLKNHGTVIIILRKVHDDIWEDLDLLGRLQQPLQTQKGSLVTCIDDSSMEDATSQAADDTNDIMGELKSIHQGSFRYGLFQTHHNVFKDYARAGLADEMLECPNPDEVSNNHEDDEDVSDRREIRLEMENGKFDPDRYLGDAGLEEGDDMIYDAAICMVPHWIDVAAKSSSNAATAVTTDTSSTAFFTQEESHQLATLKKCELPAMNNNQMQSTLMTLSDILFAYAYDHRTTDGESTIESSWTMMILSPTLSWLESYNAPYDSICDVMRWCTRRSLIYPYLRSYKLSMKTVGDVANILCTGRRVVLRCLLQVHSIMEKSECHYLFNKLYVDPMIWWVQSCKEEIFQTFGQEMRQALSLDSTCKDECVEDESNLLAKKYMGLNLFELEHAQFDEEDDSTSGSRESDSSSQATADDANSSEEGEMVQLIESLDISAHVGSAK